MRGCAPLRWTAARATALGFADHSVGIADDEAVVLAVPPEACASLMPDIETPQRSNPILNAHFRTDRKVELPGGMPFLGLTGSESQWLFARGEAVSVTVSAAGRLIDRPGRELAELLWREIAPVLGRPADPLPPWRMVKEHRATIAQTPAGIRAPAGDRHGIPQRLSRRRLDRDRAAGDHRGQHSVGISRRRDRRPHPRRSARGLTRLG